MNRSLSARCCLIVISGIWVGLTKADLDHHRHHHHLDNDDHNLRHQHHHHHHHHHRHGRRDDHDHRYLLVEQDLEAGDTSASFYGEKINRCGTSDLDLTTMLTIEQEIKAWQEIHNEPCTEESCTFLEQLERGAATTTIINVPTVWHVIRNADGSGGITTQQIEDSMVVLNNAYNDAGFSFTLQGTTTTDNDQYYRAAFSSAEYKMKSQLHQGDAATLNIYSSGIFVHRRILGFATFPYSYRPEPLSDGVVIASSSVPGGNIESYNEGDTLTHEVGHWLGLYHVFHGGGCFGYGDFVLDTPRQAVPTEGCPEEETNTCSFCMGKDSIHNFMDYSTDTCMTSFTNGQKRRMINQWNTYRRNGGRFAPPSTTSYYRSPNYYMDVATDYVARVANSLFSTFHLT